MSKEKYTPKLVRRLASPLDPTKPRGKLEEWAPHERPAPTEFPKISREASRVMGNTLLAGILAVGAIHYADRALNADDTPGGHVYTVQEGDTPEGIAKQFTPNGAGHQQLMDAIQGEAMNDQTPGVVAPGDKVHVGR